jgi:uncharacterized membrane protein YidH (DUF202 family)
VPSDDGGHEPDYRVTVANERTFLAWAVVVGAVVAIPGLVASGLRVRGLRTQPERVFEGANAG